MTHLSTSPQKPAGRKLRLILLFTFLLMMFAQSRAEAACGLKPFMKISDSCTLVNFKGTNLHDSSAGPAPSPSCLAYSWIFGDGSTATGADVTHTYASSGTYTVCLIIKNTCLGCSDTVCQTFTTICPTPCGHMPVGWRQVDSCSTIDFQGYDARLPRAGTYKDPCLVYTWNFGDGDTAKGQNVRHEYAARGTYTVCMTVKDTCKGCDTTICRSVTVSCISNCAGITKTWTYTDSCPKFYFEGGSPDPGSGMDTKYRDSCLVYSWNFGDGSTGMGRLATHTYTKNGSYYVSLRVQDTCRGCDTTITKRITVSCLKSCDLRTGWTQTDSCGNYNFTGETDTMARCPVYAWDFGDSTYAYGKTVKHAYTKTGTYRVCMAVRDTCTGCDTIVCKTITVTCVTPSSIKAIDKSAARTSVFPNPASGSFMLLSPGENAYTIVDAYGRVAASGHFTDKAVLSGDGLSNGVYLVQLRSGEQSTTIKLIISK